MSPNFDHVPRYVHTVRKGDAIYVPTWTWHRVDYISSEEVAISGSLFHFRPLDFFRLNPLHATMILPNLIMEMTGLKAQ
jgi:gentisate 1,2-dioxygenase